jgi:FixJ family two-component response regulator
MIRKAAVGPPGLGPRSNCCDKRREVPLLQVGKGAVSKRSETSYVFIVDDDESMRASGIRAKAFATPEAFLDEVDATSEGCVLLDITMPNVTGLQVQEELTRKGVHLPVIAVSARDSDKVREMARELGASFFLHKPVDDQALLDAIAWVTDEAHTKLEP